MADWSEQRSWSEENQQQFFNNLKECAPAEQADAVLRQSETLIEVAGDKNQDLLKAAESLLNLWLLRYSTYNGKDIANQLLAKVYINLGQEEKARKFSRKP